ncbi:hypothetical protein ACJX0J_039206, partial [Zea mays]
DILLHYKSIFSESQFLILSECHIFHPHIKFRLCFLLYILLKIDMTILGSNFGMPRKYYGRVWFNSVIISSTMFIIYINSFCIYLIKLEIKPGYYDWSTSVHITSDAMQNVPVLLLLNLIDIQLHAIAMKLALDSNSFVGTAVLDVYAKCITTCASLALMIEGMQLHADVIKMFQGYLQMKGAPMFLCGLLSI